MKVQEKMRTFVSTVTSSWNEQLLDLTSRLEKRASIQVNLDIVFKNFLQLVKSGKKLQLCQGIKKLMKIKMHIN